MKEFKVIVHQKENPPKQSPWVENKKEFLVYLSEIIDTISDEELTGITRIIVFTRLKD